MAFGSAWISLLYAGAGNDTVIASGTALGNTVYGEDGNDSLSGGGAQDYLDGGTGNDTLGGGAGDDVYILDSAADVVVEAAGGGADRVFATVTIAALAAEVEELVLLGAANINGTGNQLGNVITGNAGNNILFGGVGDDSLEGGDGNDTLRGQQDNDTLVGGAGADQLEGGGGADTYVIDALDTLIDTAGIDTVVAEFSYTLLANFEKLVLGGTANINGGGNAADNTLTGNTGRNQLFGFDGNDSLVGGDGPDTLEGGLGNDTLTGGTGADRLDGGDGDDTYVLAGADTILDSSGIDTVRTNFAHVLGAALENLVLTGGAAIAGTGNGLGNAITGNAAANLIAGLDGDDNLLGGKGNDTLVGGLGADTLEGGTGADAFRYGSAAEGGDVIIGYAGAADRLEVSAAGFGAGLFAGMDLVIALRYAANPTGTATQAQGQFLFNTITRVLSWDADGTGAGGAEMIADLTGAGSWNGSEIVVIA